jgi:hypothetical protein
MEDDLLFPEARQILEEADSRHAGLFAYAYEAIALAHLAYDRQRDFATTLIPGIPSARRVRTDINDDAWRFFRAMAEPLVEDGRINKFDQIDGGDVALLWDGLHVRLKKGDATGATSNYPTPKVAPMGSVATQYALFPGTTELDRYIQEGSWMDVVFKAGQAMGEFTQIGLRFAMASASPFLVLDPPSPVMLQGISPAASEVAADLRARLTA